MTLRSRFLYFSPALVLLLAGLPACNDDVATDDDAGTGTGTSGSTDTEATETSSGDTDSLEHCGNGLIDNGEQCEGTNLNGFSCVDLGFMDGELACGADCLFDATDCSEVVCGDGLIGGNETCDGEALAEQSCETLGYTGGELACSDDCSAFDESGCYTAVCGDGMVSGPEPCDGEDLGGNSCVDLGFGGGELACLDDCSFDTAACLSCGNGVIDDGELCDGEDLGEADCADFGWLGGPLACNDGCDGFIEDGCVDAWWADDFEAGMPLSPEWVTGGDAEWFVSATNPHGGMWNAESGDIGDSQNTSLEVTVDFVMDGSVTFWRRTSTELNFDTLRFFVDDVQQGLWSGGAGWNMQNFLIDAGVHTLRWTYGKDGSNSVGFDAVWIDDVETFGGVLP